MIPREDFAKADCWNGADDHARRSRIRRLYDQGS